MTFKEIIKYFNIDINEAARRTGKTANGLWHYFKGDAGSSTSATITAIGKEYDFHYEIVTWPKIEGKNKWESLEIEAKRLQSKE